MPKSSISLKSIDEVDISDKILFIRTDFDFNPDLDYQLAQYKLDYVLKTVNYAAEQGARLVIASHVDVPIHRYDKKYSLENIAGMLGEKISRNIYFPENCFGDAVKKIKNEMRPGEIMLLENLMFHDSEVNNDSSFAKKLADSIDVYVNESFPLIGNNYASNNAILSFINEKCVGFSFNNDIDNLNKIKYYEGDDMVVYFGGDDIGIKLNFIESYIDRIRVLVLGGKILYSFLYSIGYGIDKQFIDESVLFRLKKLHSSFKTRNKKILVPEDFYISIRTKSSEIYQVSRKALKDDFYIHGFGSKTMEIYENELAGSEFIIWDGCPGTNQSGKSGDDAGKLASVVVNTAGRVVLLCDYGTFLKQNEILNEGNINKILNKNTAYKYLDGQELESLVKLSQP